MQCAASLLVLSMAKYHATNITQLMERIYSIKLYPQNIN